MSEQDFKANYSSLLKAYASSPEEKYLVEVAQLGRSLVLENVPPEEIAEIHEDAINSLAQDFPDKTLLELVNRISTPLMELLMAYGIAFRELLDQRKQAEEALIKTTNELKTEREELAEMNLVFKHVLEHIEEERQEYKQQICQEIEQAFIPVITRLQEKVDPSHAGAFANLQTNLKEILDKDVDMFRQRYAKLTPREMEICDMIKEGLSSKEISDCLNLSLLTVHKHREEIRKKLGITNKNVNLGSYLRTR